MSGEEEGEHKTWEKKIKYGRLVSLSIQDCKRHRNWLLDYVRQSYFVPVGSPFHSPRLLSHSFCPLVSPQISQTLLYPLINGLASHLTKTFKSSYSKSSIFLPPCLHPYISSLLLHSQFRKPLLPRQITPSFLLVLNII